MVGVVVDACNGLLWVGYRVGFLLLGGTLFVADMLLGPEAIRLWVCPGRVRERVCFWVRAGGVVV